MGTIIYDYLNFKRDNRFEGSTLPNHPTNERIKFINIRINEEQKGYVKKTKTCSMKPVLNMEDSQEVSRSSDSL